MKEFVEKPIEKIKVTSLEIIVTGTKDKPYFEIKYKEVGKEDYNIGYSSYDLNNVLNWKEEFFEIVNKLAEEYGKDTIVTTNNDWIPCSERLPSKEECGRYGSKEFQVTIQQADGNKTIAMDFEYVVIKGKEVARWKWCGRISPWEVLAWKPMSEPYQKGE